MDRVWYVDDDELSFQLHEPALRAGLPDAQIRRFGTCEAALDEARTERPDVVVLDEHFKESAMQGRRLLPALRALYRRIPIILITAHPTVDLVLSVMRMGAADCLFKPFATEDLIRVIRHALAERKLDRRAEAFEEPPPPTEASFEGLVGTTAVMQDLMKRVEAFARTEAVVLITGETGTGKGLLARYVHDLSPRASGPFVNANLVATSENLIESSLFGHEKGAFTGAEARRIGKFERAAGGTIFLDEIGELTPELQLKLLRVLEEGEFERLGGHETLRVNTRVIAATNRDLLHLSEEGRFREDLYYRIRVCQAHMPPLRKRMDDLEALVHHLIPRFNAKYGRTVRRVHPDLMRRWREHRWPGNLRELAAAVQEAVIQSEGEELVPAAHWPETPSEDDKVEMRLHALTKDLSLPESMRRMKRARIFPALDAGRKANGTWNIYRTSLELGISITALQDFLVEEFLRGPLASTGIEDEEEAQAILVREYQIGADQALSLLRHAQARGKSRRR